MSKQVITNYVFDPASGTVQLPDFDAVRLDRLALITHLPTNTIIYSFVDPIRGGTVAGNTIILDWDTSAFSASDPLRIDYNSLFDDPHYDKLVVGNSRSKLRDSFATQGVQPNPDTWDTTNDHPSEHILSQGGDAAGSTYLRISLSPFVEDSEISLTSKKKFKFPVRVGYGLSVSQRILGQEVFVGVTEAHPTAAGANKITPVADKPITGATASITSNVATFTVTAHGLKGGDRVAIVGCVERRLNVGPVVVTVVDADNFTVPCTLANGTYSTVGGTVKTVDPLAYSKNSVGLLAENTTTTNASFVSRRNGAKFRSLNSTIATTTATQSNTSPYTDAFNAAGQHEIYGMLDEVSYRSYATDSNSGMNGTGKYTQAVPDEDGEYRLHVRAKVLPGATKPVARIVSIAKTGTTTATVTTDAPHGLATTDFVQIYGVRDQTNFPNLTAQTAVASVPSATTFTVVIGTASTTSSAGGTVWLNQGSVLAPGVFAQAVQSVSRTNNVLTLVGSGTWATPLPGEYVHVHGLESAASAYEGAYKVLRVSTTTLELEAPGANFSSITTGGTVIRRTDVRLHFARMLDYTRLGVEVLGGRGNSTDANNAAPVALVQGVAQGSGVNTTAWSAAGWGGFLVADITSAAITSTVTSSAVVPGTVNYIGTYAHEFNVVVTAVSGTSPTLDVAIEESPDNGTNWVRIYEFPRITATGTYTSPLIRATFGTRYRYVRTVGGTSPSFTMSLNRIQFSSAAAFHRQFFDRSIVLTTLNSTTPSYTVDGATRLALVVNVGAITTTAPQIQLEGSEDNSGGWYALGTPLTAVASSTVMQMVNDVIPKFVRARVSTAGVGVTAGYVSIKAHGA